MDTGEISIAQNHNWSEWIGSIQSARNACNQIAIVQTKVNELYGQQKKTEYVNFEGQKIGSVINDIA